MLEQFGDASVGLGGFITSLTDGSTGITSQALWDQIIPAVGLIVTIFIFAFGYRFVRRLLTRGSKGKV